MPSSGWPPRRARPLPRHCPVASTKARDADINVTVQSVKERVLPDLDDDFAQLASEYDTLEELRADIQGQAERAKKMEQGVQARDKVLEHLLGHH